MQSKAFEVLQLQGKKLQKRTKKTQIKANKFSRRFPSLTKNNENAAGAAS